MTAIRQRAFVAAYLILRKDNQVLLSLRKNTGYCDGMYSLVAGHVDEGEKASHAMIREAKEEAGIDIMPDQLRVVHMMHRMDNRFNMDIFFECTSWQGMICNQEPHKCEALQFFPIGDLPSNCVEYIRMALIDGSRGCFYSEPGWL